MQNVDDLLAEHRVFQPPVPIEAIAIQRGITVCPLPGSTDVSGAIASHNGKTVIAVNPTHHRNRQRFTIAHELGHLYLGHMSQIGSEHVDGDFTVRFRDREAAMATDLLEIEANRFAAELLMPSTFLQRDLNIIGTPNENMVKLMAKRYEVSPQAMRIRLINLGYLAPDF